MRYSATTWSLTAGWRDHGEPVANPALVLFFAGPAVLGMMEPYAVLQGKFPLAQIVGCTTGGEIFQDQVSDSGLVAMAIQYDDTSVRVAVQNLEYPQDSGQAGKELARTLLGKDLNAVIVLADGLSTDGAALVDGLRAVLPETVTITGGLAADGADFKLTRTACNGPLQPYQAVAVGLYGNAIRIGWGSIGGWKPYGEVHRITRSAYNVLYELDGKPALQIYKDYLGSRAADLPGAGLLYPLAVWTGDDEAHFTVRTITGTNESANSLTFAGTMPEGASARLMQASLTDLIGGAQQAGQHARLDVQHGGIAILVSCIGRKLLMAQRSVDEVKAVSNALGSQFMPIGFYSYGEIAPNDFNAKCELHNQTMTVTTISEVT